MERRTADSTQAESAYDHLASLASSEAGDAISISRILRMRLPSSWRTRLSSARPSSVVLARRSKSALAARCAGGGARWAGSPSALANQAATLRPPPELVPLCATCRGRGKPAWAALADTQQPGAFPGHARALRDLRQGDVLIRQYPDRADPGHRGLHIFDSAQYRCQVGGCLTVEIQVLHASRGAHRRVIAAHLSQGVECLVGLHIGACDDERELVSLSHGDLLCAGSCGPGP